MFELLTIIVFAWILIKAIGLILKLTWGAAKIISSILIVFAFPLLIVGLLFVGGMILLVPIIIVCIAAGIAKVCIKA